MNFLKVLHSEGALEVVIKGAEEPNFSTAKSALEEQGIVVARGSSDALKKLGLWAQSQKERNFVVYPFVHISGEFLKTGVSIPVHSRAVTRIALQHLKIYKGRTRWNLMKLSALSFINELGLFSLIFPKKFIIIADASCDHLLSFLSREFHQKNITFSIYAGEKAILPIFSIKTGEALGYAKVYPPEHEVRKYSKIEVATLRQLQDVLSGEFSVPEVLFSKEFGKYLVVGLSTVLGVRSFARATGHHIEFLRILSSHIGNKQKFETSEFVKIFKEQINFLASNYSDYTSLVERFWDVCTTHFKNKDIFLSLTMREFPPSQLIAHNEGYLVVDWEYASHTFPPVFDFFNLCMNSGQYKKGDYVEVYKKNLKDLFFSKNTMVSDGLKVLKPVWGYTNEDLYYLLHLYLLDQLYIHLYAGHTRSAERITSFLERYQANEGWYLDHWLGSGLVSNES